MKASRILQIKRIEKELMKLQRRFEMVTDPEYVSNMKLKLRSMETEGKEVKDTINRLEIDATILDKRILKNSKHYQNLNAITGQDRKVNLQGEVMAGIEIT